MAIYERKGGSVDDTVGRVCLCNALTANVGLGQTRKTGYSEPPLVTLGSDRDSVRAMAGAFGTRWRAADVIDWLMSAQ